jgi:hypothetical protein
MLRLFAWVLVIIGAIHILIGLWFAIVTEHVAVTETVDRLWTAFFSTSAGAAGVLLGLALLQRDLVRDILSDAVTWFRERKH